MAGIGFRLRALSEGESLLSPVASIGHAAVIAAGPWLFTVIALALVSSLTSQSAPASTVEGFRLLIIYAFAVSLVAVAPVVIVASRLVGDAIYIGAYDRIRALFVATVLVATVVCTVVALLGCLALFSLGARETVAGVSCCAVIGLIWVALAFCGAVRDYKGITIGFFLGLMVSVMGALWAATVGAGSGEMVWAFSGGLVLIFCVLASRVLSTFPHPVLAVGPPLAFLASGLWQFRRLAVGGIVAAVALWVDKWIVWAGPSGVVHELGLVHAPLYDSAMFTAYLAIIPALALFVTHVETSFFERYRAYYAAIRAHATLGQIEQRAAALEQATARTLTHITLVQAALCLIVVLGASSIVELSGLHYQQVGILRLGALGALFQFVFFSATSLLLFFERHTQFLWLQVMFLALQVTMTALTVQLGPSTYGLGNLVACVFSGVAALAVLEATMRHLTFITFFSASRSDAGSASSGPRLATS